MRPLTKTTQFKCTLKKNVNQRQVSCCWRKKSKFFFNHASNNNLLWHDEVKIFSHFKVKIETKVEKVKYFSREKLLTTLSYTCQVLLPFFKTTLKTISTNMISSKVQMTSRNFGLCLTPMLVTKALTPSFLRLWRHLWTTPYSF